jgi:ribonuclease T1
MLKMLSKWLKNYISGAKISFLHVVSLSLLLTVFGLTMGTAHSRNLMSSEASTSVSVAELPKQGQQVYALILQGGPFEYDKDGVVFGNREQQLPKNKRGYYREYTVKTPGVRHRGAKRIVCGGLQVQSPDACYYTEDHYSSFRKIVR